MRPSTRERLRLDRNNLRAALRDARSGRAKHLPAKDQQQFIAAVERRITAIDAKLKGEPDA